MQGPRTFALVGSIVLCACQSQANPAADVSAVIVEPTAQSRAELQRVVSGALHDVPVQLADDALTDSSLLVIERKQHRTLEGRIGGDRITEPPEQFRLVVNDSRCVLIHSKTGERYQLIEPTCQPVPD